MLVRLNKTHLLHLFTCLHHHCWSPGFSSFGRRSYQLIINNFATLCRSLQVYNWQIFLLEYCFSLLRLQALKCTPSLTFFFFFGPLWQPPLHLRNYTAPSTEARRHCCVRSNFHLQPSPRFSLNHRNHHHNQQNVVKWIHVHLHSQFQHFLYRIKGRNRIKTKTKWA